MDDDFFLDEHAPRSDRFAVVADEGDSVWLYLTRRGSQEIEFDCWLFNKPSAPREPEVEFYRARSLPPPVPAEWMLPSGVREPPAPERCSFQWAAGGEAVLFLVGDEAIGCITARERRSFSRYLVKAGGWGNPWDEDLVRRTFGGGGASESGRGGDLGNRSSNR